MQIKTLIAATALVFATLGAAPSLAKDVVIGTEGAYAPWNLTNADGTLDGFEIELMKDVCPRAQLNCTFMTHDWDTMIESLNANKFDVILDGLSITPERAKAIAFSIPYASTPVGFATLKDSPLANLPGTGTSITLTGDAAHDKPLIDKFRDAFKDKTIGVQAATIYTKWLDDNFGSIATIREYKTVAERDADLVAGRVDATVDDETALGASLETKGNEDMVLTGPQMAGPAWGPGIGLGLRKADTDLKAAFDKAIQAAIDDGTVKKLSEKWFKLDVTPKQ
ncbi:MAG TPA: transporter substrate-binding domain-containing protein [Devosiaceae bacterium]|jgi:octopine/nopaline transport system substrate-binding protein|nr:transporter substrate-binding domain-containing protein [Devosiaceae bacterium]